MRRAILTIGPRGCGKSTYCQQIIKERPDISLVSRDQIMLEIYGKVGLNLKRESPVPIFETMWARIAEHFEREEVIVIIDCWNGWGDDRQFLTKKLRQLGADTIDGWYFVVPENVCAQWCVEKEVINHPALRDEDDSWQLKLRAASARQEYRRYHDQPVELDQGFDAIHIINPLQLAFLTFIPILNTT
ncbi:MAG: hypothetical protein KBB55_00660 [Candidatus Buchananbacteria bacterium]|nr:hypothetical protein [Candidatus Buchananbacteria bacterium]